MKQPMLDAPAAEWSVYGDALQVAGDPRGELIALANAPAGDRDAYVAKHAAALLGDLAAKYLDAYVLEWRYCLLDRIEIRVTPDAQERGLVHGILRSPAAEHVREIVLVGMAEPDKPVDLTRAMAALAELAPESATSFAFVDHRAQHAKMLVATYFDPEPNLVTFGSLAPFFRRAEHLRIVTADSHQVPLDDIEAPQLESFQLDCLRFADREDIETMSGRLATAKWPKLESFACRLVETWGASIPLEDEPYVSIYETRWEGEENDRYEEADEGETDGVNWEGFAAVLRNLAACPLRRLALTSCQSVRSLLETLADTNLPDKLELDLSDGALVGVDLDWLLDSRLVERLAKLVAHRIMVSEDQIKIFVERFARKGVIVEGSSGGADATYRFVVGME